MEHSKQKFLSFWTFLSFYPTNNVENQNFEKREQKPRDIIFLQVYRKWKS